MANKIKPKRSYTTSVVPTGLVGSELAINCADKKVYMASADAASVILVSSMAISDHTGTTDNLTQGSTNKFYADSLARAAISSSATGLTYTSATGVFSLTSGYSIPTTSSQTNWDSGYTQRLQWDGGATNLIAATGRTSLGLVIGTNVQAWDADIDSIAAIAGTTGILKKTAANTWSLDTSTYLTANQTVTLSGDVTGSGSNAITTTLATVSIAKGGTGQTTANAGLNALLPTQASNSGKYLTSNGTNTSWGAVVGGPSFTASATAPASPASGDRWYDTSTGCYLIYFSDGTSSQWVETSNSGMVSNPTGTIIPFAGANAPTGFLLCNGASVSSSDYLALHSVISNTYGGSAYSGAAALNFTLPDYRGRVLIGAGTGSGLTARTLGGSTGTENTTLDYTQIPAHTHPNTVSGGGTSSAGSHTHTLSKEVLTYRGSGGDRYDPYPGSVWQGSAGAGLTLATAPDHYHTFTPSITNNNNTGGGGTHSNMQPSIGVNYLIKT
jgi:microcystin-dependent protein